MRSLRVATCSFALFGFGWMTGPATAQTTVSDDVIRASALVHLATVLFPAGIDPRAPLCVGVMARDIDGPPADSARDPSPALLATVRASVPKAVAHSTCAMPGPTVGSKSPEDLARRPIAYYVGPVRRLRSGTTVTVAYWVHGLNGGAWTCELSAAGGRWRVRDCLPLWIS